MPEGSPPKYTRGDGEPGGKSGRLDGRGRDGGRRARAVSKGVQRVKMSLGVGGSIGERMHYITVSSYTGVVGEMEFANADIRPIPNFGS